MAAFVAVDKDDNEVIFQYKPIKGNAIWYLDCEYFYVNLPSGTIEKLIGRKLNWEDEPVEIS